MSENTRMTVKDFRREEGYENSEEWNSFLEDIAYDSISPALCTYGCEVEPDGICEHGNPSILIALGFV